MASSAAQIQNMNQEKRPRPQPEEALKCPRCDSPNTKFCYYNNYSLSQPRHFCKACKRYWTKGGSLRNVPVGGGCRKSKKSSSNLKRPPAQPFASSSPTPFPSSSSLGFDSSDLNLAFARLHSQPARQLGLDDHETPLIFGNPNSTGASFLDSLSVLLDGDCSYGFGAGGFEEVGGHHQLAYLDGMVGGGVGVGTMTTSATAVRQESCRSGDLESKSIWGMQWPLGGDGSVVSDNGRDRWNGIGSTWAGLVDGPLV